MAGIGDCCRFSLDTAGRRLPALGTGSLEGRGSPDGLDPVVAGWSMTTIVNLRQVLRAAKELSVFDHAVNEDGVAAVNMLDSDY